MTSEREVGARNIQDPVRTVIRLATLVAIDKVKGDFGVEYSVVADEGQPYTYLGRKERKVPEGCRYVYITRQPNQDLGPFWRSVNAIEKASKQVTS